MPSQQWAMPVPLHSGQGSRRNQPGLVATAMLPQPSQFEHFMVYAAALMPRPPIENER
jgi:hypothetical protein